MRWENLSAERDRSSRLPGLEVDTVVRTFDAPEAVGIRFHEIHARSAINRVPGRSPMPFRWTINPYRGCTHACAYCQRGETPILMGDGRTKPLAELQVGDAIYGTVREGNYRRYAITKVLDHWSTVKPAYRVTLEDGTELIASGDHRFLSDRGWKHVIGAEQGLRPHLTASDELVCTGGEEVAPGKSVDARLNVVSIEPLGKELKLFDITTGTGDFIADGVVSHNCYARSTHTYLDMNAGRDFEREIIVKVNAPELVRAELARPSWRGEHVALGTNTDPYQWVESRYKLMEGIWSAMRDARNPCSLVTKSPLVLRDIEILREIAKRTSILVFLSVPTLEEQAWRSTEPHTPHPRKRLEAIARLNEAGVPAGVLIAPLMPGINDDPAQVEEIVRLAREAGAVSIGGNALHLRKEVKEIMFDWLRLHRPDLLPRYEELYARGAYMPATERRRLQALIARHRPRRRPRARPKPPPKRCDVDRDPPQESLF